MTATKEEELCRALMWAESDHEVLDLLERAGYWTDPNAWRAVGDNTNNKGVIGNQQEDATSALVEKLTNSIDAVLINRCLEAGIDPRGADAPQSMREAIAKFFEGSRDAAQGGRSRYWGVDRLDDDQIDTLARNVWVVATGSKTSPSISIADRGEGQVPDDFSRTFMALIGFKNAEGGTESQKKDIRFVQGQFNMGSSGVYPFASDPNGFQLLLSRRNPSLLDGRASKRDHEWGFTVVRRTKNEMTGSVFEYLAPARGEDGSRAILAFAAETMPIIPESPPQTVPNIPYATEVQYGTLVKLYEYRYRQPGLGYSHVLRRSGLMPQLELALPESGLPVRVVEARDGYRGRPGSFQNNMLGILHRLETLASKGSAASTDEDEDAEDGEAKTPLGLEGRPVHGEMIIQGVAIPWTAFVFTDNAGDRTGGGRSALILHVNGQKHALDSTDFFRRKTVGYSFLAKNNAILVVVDCTSLSVLQREEIFKPSRDRLHRSALSFELLDLLSDSLKSNSQLEQLQNQQYHRKQKERLANKAPIRTVLEQLIKSQPTLARFFRFGTDLRVTRPFPGADVGHSTGAGTFVGKKHPTYLRLRNGETSRKQAASIGSKARIHFSTDVEDAYFNRALSPGTFTARYVSREEPLSGNRGNLHSGSFSFALSLPEDLAPGDVVDVEFELSDGVMTESLRCEVTLEILAPHPRPPRPEPPPPPKDRKTASNLSDLEIVRCCRESPPREGCDLSWPNETWDDYTAVTIEENPETGGLTYYVNVDNLFLLDYQKANLSKDPALIEAKFMWSEVLMALSIVEHYRKLEERQSNREVDDEAIDQEQPLASKRDEDVERMTRACAQLILPTMDAVGSKRGLAPRSESQR